MKIRMDVPEHTGVTFKLAMRQKPQVGISDIKEN